MFNGNGKFALRYMPEKMCFRVGSSESDLLLASDLGSLDPFGPHELQGDVWNLKVDSMQGISATTAGF